MNTSKRVTVVAIVVAGCGFALAAFLATHTVEANSGFCSSGGCVAVLTSAFSRFAGVKTAWLGAGLYALLAGLGLIRLQTIGGAPRVEHNAYWTPSLSRNVARAAWGLTVFGVSVSWWLQSVAAFDIKQFCPYCFGSACAMTLLFFAWTYESWMLPEAGQPIRAIPSIGLPAVVALVAIRVGAAGLSVWSAAADAKRANVTTVAESADIRDNLTRPTPLVLGAATAPDLLVEFGDYQCEACRHGQKPIEDLLEKYRAHLRLVFRSKCWDMHPWSRQASEAAFAAASQGKFRPMHNYLFAHQAEMAAPGFRANEFSKFARAAGLDEGKFKLDMDSRRFRHDVETDISDAASCDVTTTPTVYLVTSKSISRFQTLPALAELDRVLAMRYGGK